MKKTIFCIVIILGLGNSGCLLTQMLGGAESPRPKEYQIEAAKDIATQNVEEIMKGQLSKQNSIKEVGLMALAVLGGGETRDERDMSSPTEIKKEVKPAKEDIFFGKKDITPAVASAITNVVANSVKGILNSDGSAELLSKLTGNANKSILEMSALEYLGYVGGQTAVAMRNQEAAYQGIKVGWQWTKTAIASVAGGVTGTGGLIAFALSAYRKMRNKDRLLKSTGSTINEFVAAEPESGTKLKARLAKATSRLPVDAKTEFGV